MSLLFCDIFLVEQNWILFSFFLGIPRLEDD